MAKCASDRGPENRNWIGPEITEVYCELHRLGFAHSVEAWRDGKLVGGLYGVALKGAFFGESMFSVRGTGTDASKVCLVHLVDRLRRGLLRAFGAGLRAVLRARRLRSRERAEGGKQRGVVDAVDAHVDLSDSVDASRVVR